MDFFHHSWRLKWSHAWLLSKKWDVPNISHVVQFTVCYVSLDILVYAADILYLIDLSDAVVLEEKTNDEYTLSGIEAETKCVK